MGKEDLISRQAAIDIASGYCHPANIAKELAQLPSVQRDTDEWCLNCSEYDQERHCCPRWNRVIRETLKDAQPERKRGKWLYGEDEYGIDGYSCEKCGFFVPWDYAHKFINYIEDYHYCPNCGADMRGEQS